MANSIDISYSNGVFTVMRGSQVTGQGRALETALENANDEHFPPEAYFHAAEVLRAIMGETSETHGQVATREP